jgi:hypothetical protein
VESRRQAGVRERTFLQSTPIGDFVIVTLEGDDPIADLHAVTAVSRRPAEYRKRRE